MAKTPTLPHAPASAVLALLLMVLGGSAALGQEVKWTDLDPDRQMADWEDSANWGGFSAPNAPEAAASINTPKISKYLVLHQPTTVGTLTVHGKNSISGGILAAEGSGAILRFDNGDAPALFTYARESRENINIPIEFARDLIITNGTPSRKEAGSITGLFFDTATTFTPLCSDGKASLTFAIHSRIFPWRDRNFLDRKNQNAVLGFIEDSLDGAPLSLTKEGAGSLAIACCDNAYSGGTTVRDGYLYGVNAENLDPPFLPFGTHPAITLENDTTLSLLSSKSGTWGPGEGYVLTCKGNARITAAPAADWNNINPPWHDSLLHSIQSLTFAGSVLDIATYGEAKLRIATPLLLAQPTKLIVQRNGNRFLSRSDADFPTGIHQSGATPVSIEKHGTGILRIGADSTFVGGLNVISGSVAVASSRALGTGPTHFGPSTTLLIECPTFKPTGGIQMDPQAREVWRHPLARLGTTPDDKAGCRIAPGVSLGIAADLSALKNKTIVLDGGRLYAYRDHAASPTNSYTLGPGIALYSISTNLHIGTPWVPKESEFANKDRIGGAPLILLGPIREHGVSTTLHKHSNDRLEIGGICSYTGGTIIHKGTLAVLPSGRLPPGTIHLKSPGQYEETCLRLSHPGNLSEGTTISLEKGAKINLNFEGEVIIKQLIIEGKRQAPGVWATGKGNGVTHVEYRRLSGKGRLRIAE